MTPDRAGVAAQSHLPVDRAIWLGIWLGPVAWTIAAGAGYVVASRACVAGRTALAETAVIVLGGVAALLSLFALTSSYRRWHGAREHRRFMAGARADSVGSFLAWAGTSISALALVGSVFIAIAPFFLTPCAQSW